MSSANSYQDDFESSVLFGEESEETKLFDVNEDKLRQYLKDMRLEDLFAEIVEELLVQAPDNPVKFILDYIYNVYPDQAKNSSYAKTFAKSSQNLVGGGVPMTGLVEDIDAYGSGDEGKSETDSDNEVEESETPYVEMNKRSNSTRSRRFCITSEVISEQIDKDNIKTYPKTEAEVEIIVKALDVNPFFSHLLPEQKVTMTEYFESAKFRKGDYICKEGKEGSTFYIICEGECETLVQDKSIMFCEAGDAFGERGLLYSHKYAASQKVTSAILRCWKISRSSYKIQMMSLSQNRIAELVNILDAVRIFNTLTTLEKCTLADALEVKVFEPETVIFRQHDPGNAFYIILSGEICCLQRMSSSQPESLVATLTRGDYFGEIALITARPRAASMKVSREGPSTCLKLERRRFIRLLGPLTPILKRDMNAYKKFITDKI